MNKKKDIKMRNNNNNKNWIRIKEEKNQENTNPCLSKEFFFLANIIG